MVSDPIGDMLTQIRNAYLASHKEVKVPYSKIRESLSKILVREGFLKKLEVAGKTKKVLCLKLKYEAKQPAIDRIERVSKPGRRVYVRSKKIKPVLSGLGIVILSTSAGLMTGKEARKKSLGGEVVCRLW